MKFRTLFTKYFAIRNIKKQPLGFILEAAFLILVAQKAMARMTTFHHTHSISNSDHIYHKLMGRCSHTLGSYSQYYNVPSVSMNVRYL